MPSHAILADTNSQLIEAYQAVKDDWQNVQALLHKHHRLHSKDYYYHIRQQRPITSTERAASFIYLNRTCWNGLYRVNLKGEFNVPIGTKTNVLLDTDDFESIATLLSGIELLNVDFESTLRVATTGDFVFVDPPYTVKHNQNGFIKYNESIFTWDDQIRLKNAVQSAVERGAKVIVTNANHESLRELYKGLGEQIILDRASVIAGQSGKRGRYEEMVIKCI
jgi:DNA adenine methylase